MKRLAFLLVLAGCPGGGTPRATPPSNTAQSPRWAPTLPLDAAHVEGLLAIAPDASWQAPAGATALVIDHDLPEGTALTAIPSRGEPEPVQAAAATSIPFGCDNNQLAVVPVEGAAPLAPGPVWLISTQPPDGWAPAGVELRAGDAARDHREWTAGPLAIALTRLDDLRARLEIRADGTVLHTSDEETYTMEGADPAHIDLAADFQPGIPHPVAAFLIAPDGPALVVFETQGYEGETITTLLVGPDRAEPVDSLQLYLYRCAF